LEQWRAQTGGEDITDNGWTISPTGAGHQVESRGNGQGELEELGVDDSRHLRH